MKSNLSTVAILLFIILTGLAFIFFAMLQANPAPATNDGASADLSETDSLPEAIEDTTNEDATTPSESADTGTTVSDEPVVVSPGEEGDEPVACTMDAKQCPDGSFVGRVAPSCNFAACPVVVDTPDEIAVPEEDEPVACTADVKQCPDGTFVSRVAPSCNFAACPVVVNNLNIQSPEPVACPADVKQCPDGTIVGRVAPSCNFAACPVQPLNLQFQAN